MGQNLIFVAPALGVLALLYVVLAIFVGKQAGGRHGAHAAYRQGNI
jgi:hypothetical protein